MIDLTKTVKSYFRVNINFKQFCNTLLCFIDYDKMEMLIGRFIDVEPIKMWRY